MQCPYVVDKKELIIDGVHNVAKEFECGDGTIYTFYYHWDGFDQYYNCQFCKLIGRKKDVFECLNESEWHECSYYKSNKVT
jgi:hypothetical protein